MADDRRRRLDPGRRRRPAARDADPRPAAAQSGPPVAAPGCASPPSGRPRSTAAPRRPPVTCPAAPRPSSPRSPRSSARARSPRPGDRCRGRAPRRGAAPRQDRDRLGRAARSRARRSRRAGGAACGGEGAQLRCGRRRADRRPRRLERPRRPRGRLSAGAGPGFTPTDAGRDLEPIKQGLLDGDLDGIVLCHADPVRDLPDGPGWAEALRRARTVVAISNFDDASTKAADVVIPAEAYAEKEGTVTHPDGRLQRLRPAVPRPDEVRPVWQVLAEVAAALGDETEIGSVPDALAAIAAEVGFYAGITADEIGGLGVRWQEREAAAAFPREGSLHHLEHASEPPGISSASRPVMPGSDEAFAFGDLPRPLGRRGHRAQPGARVPGAQPAGRDRAGRRRAPRPRRRRRGRRALERHLGPRPGGAARPDPARRRLLDRGHRRRQRERLQLR